MAEGFSKDQAIEIPHAGRSERSKRTRYCLRQGPYHWNAGSVETGVRTLFTTCGTIDPCRGEAFGGVVVQRRRGGRNHLLRAGHLAVDD
jgi:hypothetical protein